ncbi:MAG: YabP/YqfC family sporulation protein [Anaerovorax sp.]|nr:YabP/YqfC family sporulation protein [Anaerovorax sp.]
MSFQEELLFDFSLHMPRILISGKTAVVDNVKKIVMVGNDEIIVDCGSRYLALYGIGLIVEQLEEERMLVSGNLTSIEFYGEKKQ